MSCASRKSNAPTRVPKAGRCLDASPLLLTNRNDAEVTSAKDTTTPAICGLPTLAVAHPAILYFGTPVVLISTLNEDGSPNLAPMSSAWWLGWGCMLGLTSGSKTTQNILRTGQCVLNLPSVGLVSAVNRLAMTTGSNPVPRYKEIMGFQYVADKFARAGLTPQSSDLVTPPRVAECPVQLEALLNASTPFGIGNPQIRTEISAIEVRIIRVHVDTRVQADGHPDRIDPDKWRPLIMSFRQFYGLGGRLHPSRLSEFPEELFKPAELRA
jgi:flavin reductase (DIM6/NTAB) family NADH-FMN oxidoreductase RutF